MNHHAEEQLLALHERAAELDCADPLASFVGEFVPAAGVRAYLDGNSLGRPVRDLPERVNRFVSGDWGTRLIRSWDEQWMDTPFGLGDRIAALTLGAAAGQTVVADSTTVMLYKLMSAAVAARSGRTEIIIESTNFPTDRFVAESVVHAHGLSITRLEADPVTGVSAAQIAGAVSERTALVVLSHIDYRSGVIADMAGITAVVHEAGGLMLWDLCHSVGVIPIALDDCGVDFAVGCTYKYLNGGPGAPAFAYVNHALQAAVEQPIWGWMGAGDVFGMRDSFAPAQGMRRFISGTPPIFATLPMQAMLDLIEQAGIERIREKSVSLTELAIAAYDELLAPLGVALSSPRAAGIRGGHVTLTQAGFSEVVQRLWADGVIPDYRHPDGIRIGLSPLSTTHAEVIAGIGELHAALRG